MEHVRIPSTAVDEAALRAAIGDHDPDVVSPTAELTGAQVIGDDIVLELVLPRDAYDAMALKLGSRYDLAEAVDDGRHVPAILSSSIALTPDEMADFLKISDLALRWRGSVSLVVDEHADTQPWSVVATVNGDPGVFTARGDVPGEALNKAANLRWDETPLGIPYTPPTGPDGELS